MANDIRALVILRAQKAMVLVSWNRPAWCGYFGPGVWFVAFDPGSFSIERESGGLEDSRFTAGLDFLDDTMSGDSGGVPDHGNESEV